MPTAVTAVIPVFNRADLLARLLATIRSQTAAFAEVIVVDNGSTDGAPAVARASGCRVIAMGGNAGFAKAVNQGWKAASTEWVAILNSDVELATDWLERLRSAAGEAGFATGLILSRDGVLVDGTWDLVSRAGCAWRAGHGEARASAEVAPAQKPISLAPGTACLFRRDLLAKLGGFDESFGSYLEDVDLGLRCVESGITGIYVPGAVAWHRGSATLGQWNPRVVRLLARNQLLLVAKHYDRALFRESLRAILAGQLLWGLVALRHGAGLAWLAGKRDGLRDFRLRSQPSARLREFLVESEREIKACATDSYWRWYFRLGGAI